MSSTITLVIVTENFINNKDKDVITKIISKFKYNKGFAFGFKGWADIRLVLVSLMKILWQLIKRKGGY